MKNKVVLIIRHFHCLYLMYFEVVWITFQTILPFRMTDYEFIQT